MQPIIASQEHLISLLQFLLMTSEQARFLVKPKSHTKPLIALITSKQLVFNKSQTQRPSNDFNIAG